MFSLWYGIYDILSKCFQYVYDRFIYTYKPVTYIAGYKWYIYMYITYNRLLIIHRVLKSCKRKKDRVAWYKYEVIKTGGYYQSVNGLTIAHAPGHMYGYNLLLLAN